MTLIITKYYSGMYLLVHFDLMIRFYTENRHKGAKRKTNWITNMSIIYLFQRIHGVDGFTIL